MARTTQGSAKTGAAAKKGVRSWTTPADIRDRVLRLWENGRLLRHIAEEDDLFPLEIPLKTPDATERSSLYGSAREWARELQEAHERGWFVLLIRTVRDPVLGSTDLPVRVRLNTLEDALRLVNREREAEIFRTLLAETGKSLPALVPFMAAHPMQVFSHRSEWTALVAVCGYLLEHPNPGIYLRQMDVPGVHTKIVERNYGLLTRMMDFLLAPASGEDPCAPAGTGQGLPDAPRSGEVRSAGGARSEEAHSGSAPVGDEATGDNGEEQGEGEATGTAPRGRAGFIRRFGFRDKPLRVRVRFLDRAMAAALHGLSDLTLRADEAARLDIAPSRVFIVENETSFLTFPEVKDAVVVFGAGYGFANLAGLPWLKSAKVYYWGDIDTHGFHILNDLRAILPDAVSFLMDEETLLSQKAFWGVEEKQAGGVLRRLTAEEDRVYRALLEGTHSPGLRLEQEHIAWGRVLEAVRALTEE